MRTAVFRHWQGRESGPCTIIRLRPAAGGQFRRATVLRFARCQRPAGRFRKNQTSVRQIGRRASGTASAASREVRNCPATAYSLPAGRSSGPLARPTASSGAAGAGSAWPSLGPRIAGCSRAAGTPPGIPVSGSRPGPTAGASAPGRGTLAATAGNGASCRPRFGSFCAQSAPGRRRPQRGAGSKRGRIDSGARTERRGARVDHDRCQRVADRLERRGIPGRDSKPGFGLRQAQDRARHRSSSLSLRLCRASAPRRTRHTRVSATSVR